MDDLLRIVAMHPTANSIVDLGLLLFSMAVNITQGDRRRGMATYLSLSSMSLAFFLMGPASSNWNPHVNSKPIDDQQVKALAELRRDYPAMASVIHAAAADGRIDQSEYAELVDGYGTRRVKQVYRERQERADRATVMRGPTETEKTS